VLPSSLKIKLTLLFFVSVTTEYHFFPPILIKRNLLSFFLGMKILTPLLSISSGMKKISLLKFSL